MRSLIEPKSNRGLFAVARDMSGFVQPEEWAMGWQLVSACPSGGTWCCADSEAREDPEDPDLLKAEPIAPTVERFTAFDVYQVAGCIKSRINPEETRQQAAMWLAANIEGWVSSGLEIGLCGNTSLIGLTDLTPGGGPVGCMELAALTLLRERQRDMIFDRPTLHFPAWAAPFLDSTSAVHQVADVAFGTGYGTIGAAIVAGDVGWAYITGTVEYALSEGTAEWIRQDDLTVRRQNMTEALEERRALVRFDPCGGYRVKFTAACE